MIKRLTILFILVSSSAFAHSNPSKQLQNSLNQIRRNTGARFAAMSISYAGHITTFYSGKHQPNQALFQIGSITKSFTSAILIKLQNEHKLKLTDSITKYLPQYRHWKRVRIVNLLHQNSGIFNYTKSGKFMHYLHAHPEQKTTPEQLVKIAYRHRLLYSPGRGWNYSNTNYILAGMIINKVTHAPVANSMNSLLIKPLHLKQTFYLPDTYPTQISTHMVPGFNVNNKSVNGMNMSWAGSAGAVVSTPTDLIHWYQGLFQNRILNTKERLQMTKLVNSRTGRTAPTCHRNMSYGMGIQCKTIPGFGPMWFHSGITTGYSAMLAWLPREKVTIAIAINRDLNNGHQAYAMIRPVLKILR